MGAFSDLTVDSTHEMVEDTVLDQMSAFALLWGMRKTMQGKSNTIRTLVRTEGPLSHGSIQPRGTYGIGEIDQETKLTFPLVCKYSTASMSKIEAERMGGFGSAGNSQLFASRVQSMADDMDEITEESVFANGEASSILHEGLQTFCADGVTFGTTWGGKTRTSYTTLQANVVGQAGVSLADSDLDNLFDPCQAKGLNFGTAVAFAPQATWSLIKGLFHDRINFNRMEETPSVRAGWQNVMYWDNVPILMSTKATPAATLYLIDTRYFWIEVNPNINFKSWEDPQPNSDSAILRTSLDYAFCGTKGKTAGRLYNIA